jgi:NAD(P)-dependent dehydrogenase (short-subunit alcohol dehydrogenase family)
VPGSSQPKQRVALVTGASRGGGRGIALALGEAGWAVYVTGRSTRGGRTTDGLPGTIHDTAEAVSARGGEGLAVRCDHTREFEVRALVDRIRSERSRLDLLVNNAWGGYEGVGAVFGSFWTQVVDRAWESMFVAALKAHLITTRHALSLMLPPEALEDGPAVGLCRKCGQPVRADEPHRHTDWHRLLEHERDCVGELSRVRARALVVSTVAWAYGGPIGTIYGTAKGAIVRFTYELAHELRPWGVAAVAVWPGWMRTERVMEAHAWEPFELRHTESVEYVGRGVASLAADPNVMAKTGGAYAAGDLAREYGFTDLDGAQPPGFELPWAPRRAAGG